jgi:hypothetical protein
MRVSPLPLHGSPEVPMPLEPSGQSSRGFGGGGGVGVGVGVGAAVALGFSAGAGFFSSSQPRRSVAKARASGSFDDMVTKGMGVPRSPEKSRAKTAPR